MIETALFEFKQNTPPVLEGVLLEPRDRCNFALEGEIRE
jgi:hypothetical protein